MSRLIVCCLILLHVDAAPSFESHSLQAVRPQYGGASSGGQEGIERVPSQAETFAIATNLPGGLQAASSAGVLQAAGSAQSTADGTNTTGGVTGAVAAALSVRQQILSGGKINCEPGRCWMVGSRID